MLHKHIRDMLVLVCGMAALVQLGRRTETLHHHMLLEEGCSDIDAINVVMT